MLNIVIPMAGRGSRFADAGFVQPKPFIQIEGVPMIELVIRNLRPSQPHRFIFICQLTHMEHYDVSARLQQLAPGCEVVTVPGLTAGAACSVLMASDFIDSEQPLLIANADQWVDTSIDAFLDAADRHKTDGLIMTMPSDSPKWSYICRDAVGRVCRVVEKEVVSDEATVGIYHFRKGADFCREARAMIEADDRSQNEFYVAPVYGRMYDSGLTTIDTWNIGSSMHGLGTPDDLASFLASSVLARALRGAGDSEK